MRAGHTLMKVLIGFSYVRFTLGDSFAIAAFLPALVVFILIFLEMAVAAIQAYIFTILTCIYIKDLYVSHLIFNTNTNTMIKPIDFFYISTISAVSGIYLYIKFTSGDFSGGGLGGAALGSASAFAEQPVPPIPKGAKSLLQGLEVYNIHNQELSPEAKAVLKATEEYKAAHAASTATPLVKRAEVQLLIQAIDAASIESEIKPDLLSNL